MAVVDSMENLVNIAEAAEKINVTVGILIELDANMVCGVQSAEAAVALARYAHASAGVQFRGIMGYEGHVQFVEDRSERNRLGNEANRYLVGIVKAVESAGIPVEIVSAAGTGSFDIALECTGITEVEAGSYPFMDLTYGKLDSPSTSSDRTGNHYQSSGRRPLYFGCRGKRNLHRTSKTGYSRYWVGSKTNGGTWIVEYLNGKTWDMKVGQKVHLIP